MLFDREPSLWLGLVGAVLALVVGFGVKLSGQEVSLIMAVAVAVISFLVRARVTPTGAPVLEVGTDVTTHDGEAAVVVPTN